MLVFPMIDREVGRREGITPANEVLPLGRWRSNLQIVYHRAVFHWAIEIIITHD